jgi:hypothetical protein
VLYDQIKTVSQSFGYQEYEGPILENYLYSSQVWERAGVGKGLCFPGSER